MAHSRGLLCFLTGFILVSAAWGAVIDTTGQTIQKLIGDTVEFECHATGLTQSQQVIWKFVDHDITISADQQTHVQPNSYLFKYEIFKPQDASDYWNLRIRQLEAGEAGSYRCYVSGLEDTVKVEYHLQITDAPAKPPPADLDVTSCCQARNVTCSLPICRSNTTQEEYLQILLSDCVENELLDVIICGQGGRNHMGCCLRSNLPQECQPLCGSVYDPNSDDDFTSCILHGQTILQCFIEGTAWNPSPPVSLSGAVNGEQVMLSWQQPMENADKVTGYRVNFREMGAEHFTKTMPLDPTKTFYWVTGLKKNTQYEFNVVALAGSGSSQPSYSLDIYTKGDVPDKMNVTQTVKTCCLNKKVQDDCLIYCKADSYRRDISIHPDTYIKCYGDQTNIYKCLTGQGNHKPCCLRMNVPEECTSMCEGEYLLQYPSAIRCFQYMPIISACVMENSGLLPLPPSNTRIVPGSVTSDSVTIQWDAPKDATGALRYIVAWRKHTVTTQTWSYDEVYVGTSHTITSLMSQEAYDVVVSTVNDNGSSLPELTLVVVTEGVPIVRPPETEKECCQRKGVGADCIEICDHAFRTSDRALSMGLQCYEDVLAMFECASDWRNHTACCVRNGVSKTCQGLCDVQRNYNSDSLYQFITCVDEIPKISTCFDEGKGILPRAPRQFAVVKATETSLTVDWQKPSGPDVTSYKVTYLEQGSNDLMEVNTTETFIKIDKLRANFRYTLLAYAINANGTSLPSTELKAFTKPVPYNDTIDWTEVWQNRSVCCAADHVSEACKPTCLGAPYDETKCVGDLDKILTCAADGRDHSMCCSRYPNFPQLCLPYCKGQHPPHGPQYASCLLYVEYMYSCFSEGQGLLPTPPRHLYVASYSKDNVTVMWQTPDQNCDTAVANTCNYTALIWKAGKHLGEDTVTKMKVPPGQLSYTFIGLQELTKYEMTVIAVNNHGSSLPTTVVEVLTKTNVASQVSVTQSPNGIIDVNSMVQLECALLNSWIHTIKWSFKGITKSTNNVHRIEKVGVHDEGLYTCTVTLDDGKTLESSLNLNLRYLPRPMDFKTDPFFPGMRQDIDITCTFRGFPDVVTWSKVGGSLSPSYKYLQQPLKFDLQKGLTYAMLRVMSVEDSDFGTYTCNGTNKAGYKSLSGDLKYVYPTRPTPTKPSAANMSECCRQLGVQPLCIDKICTFAIDIQTAIVDTDLAMCLFDMDKFLICGADGRDHSQCCKQKNVQEYCQPGCSGKTPDFTSGLELLQCLGDLETMLNCAQDGHQFIPSPPQNLNAFQRNTKITVTWDPPSKNADKVNVYDIFYSTSGVTRDSSVSKDSYSFDISGLQRQEYWIWATAVNHFGQSTESDRVSVAINKIGPSAPLNLQGQVVDINAIRISWQTPSSGSPSKGYVVYYGPRGTNPMLTLSSRGLTTRLEWLAFDTNFVIYVSAVNDDGQGDRSNVIYVRTGKQPQSNVSPQGGDSGSSRNKTGLAVGLVLGILCLLAICIIAFMLYRRYKAKQYAPRETVSFENPQYGPKVTGLPGEGTNEDRQFQYGHLNEEREADNAYSTVDHPNNNTTAATLHIDS